MVIDLKKFYADILSKGLSGFINEHLNQKFSVFKIFFQKNELNLVKWLSGKEILVSLNKKDLILHSEMNELEKRIIFEKSDLKITVNKISCLDEQENDISELLDQLKKKLSELYLFF